MGNPNVGKSVVFNRLTGARAIESNYPGTTVDYLEGTVSIGGEPVRIVDVPGTFSLRTRDKAEEISARMLEENPDAIVISVIDTTRIERGLYLTLEIAERGNPMIVVLNMWDVASREGMTVDLSALGGILGTKVIVTSAISGEGILELREAIPSAKRINPTSVMEEVRS